MDYKLKNNRLAVGQNYIDYVKSPNVGGTLAPKFLIIHYTASGPSFDTAAYFSKPGSKVSAHLVVRRDGSIIQCVPFNVVAWHAGKSSWVDRNGKSYSGLNQSAIGIEIENWGPLTASGSGWLSWTNVAVDGSKVIQARHKYGKPNGGWETYTEAQVTATIDASRAICSAYGITEILGHDDIAPGRKSDPGPAWNMASFQAKVFGRESDDPALFVVRSATGLNIRSGPSAAAAVLRPLPLPDGTKLIMHEADGNWCYVSTLNANGQPDLSGWVHGGYLREV